MKLILRFYNGRDVTDERIRAEEAAVIAGNFAISDVPFSLPGLNGVQKSAKMYRDEILQDAARYGPHDTVAAALDAVPSEFRRLGLTLGVLDGGQVTEYWWRGGTSDQDLVVKTSGGSDQPEGEGDDFIMY